MINILTHGNCYKRPRKYRATCPYCNCVFTFQTEDIIKILSFNEQHIKCPECDWILHIDGPYIKEIALKTEW